MFGKEGRREKRWWREPAISQKAVTEEGITEFGEWGRRSGWEGCKEALEEMWEEWRRNTKRILTFCLSSDNISSASQGLASSSGVLLRLGTQSYSPQPPAAPDYWSRICWVVIKSNADMRLKKGPLRFLQVPVCHPRKPVDSFFIVFGIGFRFFWHLCRMPRGISQGLPVLVSIEHTLMDIPMPFLCLAVASTSCSALYTYALAWLWVHHWHN